MLSTVRKMAVAREDGPVRREVEIVLGVEEDASPRRKYRGGIPGRVKDRGGFGEDGRGHVERAGHDDGTRARWAGCVGRTLAEAGRAPRLRAASTNSFSAEREEIARRTSRAHGHPAQSSDEDDDHDETRPFQGPAAFVSTLRKRYTMRSRRRELGKSEEDDR